MTCLPVFVVVVFVVNEALPLPVGLGARPLEVCGALLRAQVQVDVGVRGGAGDRWRQGEVVVSGGSRPGGQSGDQAHRAPVTCQQVRGVGGCGRRSTLIAADGGGGQAGGL